MKTILLLIALLTCAFTSTASAQISTPQLPKGVGVTAGLWNTREQTGSSLTVNVQRFGLDIALHQEFQNGLQLHSTSIVGGQAYTTEHWVTFARAGVLYRWEAMVPGITAETGLSWKLHERFAISFVLHGDLSTSGIVAGSRFGLQTQF